MPTDSVAVNGPSRLDYGKYYFDELVPFLSPKARPDRETASRDIQILRTALRRERLDDVRMVCREVRIQAEYGRLPHIQPGDAFTLRALLARTEGIYTFARFRHEALKRVEKRTSQSVADVFAQVAARGKL